MLKITADRDARRLVLEGSLAGPWVDTLDECWRDALTTHEPQQIAVDLSDVTFVDSRGRELLAAIHKAGAALFASGSMNAVLIQEIARDERRNAARGRSSRSFLWLLAGTIPSLMWLAACSSVRAVEPAKAEDSVGRPTVPVSVTPVVAGSLTETVNVVGSLSPKYAADVKSEVSGTVTAVYVTEWVPVRAGARLARLNTTENEAAIEAIKAGEAQARVAETRARREYDRALALKQYGLITVQAVDDARSALDAAEATTASAHAQVRAAEARLAKSFSTAPMDGTIALRDVNVGDRVKNMGSGAPMFRIVDNRLLDLTVSVPSAQLGAVRVGQPVEFTVDMLPGRTFVGKVMFINPTVDEVSRAAKVVAEVRNADEVLKGGLFVRGRIAVSSKAERIEEAVNSIAGVKHVSSISRDSVLQVIVEFALEVSPPLGRMTKGGSEIPLRVQGKAKSIDEFRSMVVAYRSGRPVTLGEVAETCDGVEEVRSLALVNGTPAVALDVLKQTGANAVGVADAVKKEAEALTRELPAGTTIELVRDGSVFIRESVADVQQTLIIGSLLTIFIVFLFLNSWRSTIITGLTLPISVISSFIVMYFGGMTLNTMTLMGLSLAIGLLIDDAIVVRENIVRHLENGEDHFEAARKGTSEIGLAVLATTFSIVLSLPLSVVGMAGMLTLTGDTVNVMSLIGLIMLMGLVTKNAILLVDYAKVLRGRGMARREAVIEAGRTRLRPIVMTSAAMIFGMLPLAFAIGSGAEFHAPMARAVIGGLITSTVLTLVVVPVVYNAAQGSGRGADTATARDGGAHHGDGVNPSRPELAELRNQRGILRELVTIVAAGNKPRVDLAVSVGTRNLGVSDLSSSGSTWNAAVVATVPVFDGQRARGRVAQAESEVARVSLDELKLRDAVALEVRMAVNAVEESAGVLGALDGTVKQAEPLVLLAEKGFEMGVKTRLDVQDAELNPQAARAGLARAQRDYRVARVNLVWVSGTIGN